MCDLLAHFDKLRAKVSSSQARSDFLRALLRPKTWWAKPSGRSGLIPLVVAASYYVGTLIGLSVKFQSSPISPIWPPNTILLVALVLVPMPRWRACLLAVLGAHMLAQLPDGIPLLTAFGVYLTNIAEAVLGAFLVRRLIGGAPWLGSPLRLGLYLVCAVLVAPVATSFFDAAVIVLTKLGDDYWLSFRTRCVSNILAQLTIGPALLLGLTEAREWVQHAGRRRLAEAALLVLGLLLVGIMAFGGDIKGRGADPLVLSALLPFLLWAALRFGVGGTSASLLGITIMSTWGAVMGRGPFSEFTPADNVISLQLFLIGMSVPILFLAALLQEREETKAILQASEARFRTMADHAPVLIWIADPDAFSTFFNANWLAFTGRTLEQECGMGWAEDVHPDDQARCLEVYQKAFAARLPFTIEYRLRRHDGVYRWVVDNGVPLYAANGRFEGYIGSAVDITDRKHTEQAALHQSEERFSTVFHASPTAITITTLNSRRFLDVNEATVQLLGYSREEMLGRTIPELEVVEPTDLQRLRDVRSDQTQLRNVPVRARTKSGEVRYCLVSTEAIWLSGEECLITIAHDLTERERAAEELRKAVAAAKAAEREAEQRRREAERREQIAESLRDVLTILNSSRQVTKILDYISRQAGWLLGSDAAAIYTIDSMEGGTSDPASGTLMLRAAYGLRTSPHGDRRLGAVHTHLRLAMSERRPVAVPGIPPASPEDVGTTGSDGRAVEEMDAAVADYVEMRTEPLPAPYQALLAIPILAQGEVYGGILLLYSAPRRFTADEVALAMAYGDQVALAIANAHLQNHIERAATEAERNRIARELHDTVTQEIFSASLLAQAIPRIWEQHRAEAERSLHGLYQITRGALAALRALLLELRPSALEQTALAELLRQLGDAMANRAGVPITLTVTDDFPPLPAEVKFALYRIAQEALANAAKHAAAHRITMRLVGRPGGGAIQLEVRDDGQGFEPGAVPAGHFGIGMMQERARSVGATLRIRSRIGQGTRVLVEWGGGMIQEAPSVGGERAEWEEETYETYGRARQ
jgi:PAS domain S-box-containing protein